MLECREAIDIPRLLLDGLLSEKQTELLAAIADHYGDRTVDQFRDFFQDEQADRKSLKQDYTPDAIGELIARLSVSGQALLDVCAGSGALTVAYLAHHAVDFVRCEEFSSRVIPFLLANLAIRNQAGEVIHKDVLTGEVFGAYQVIKGDQFGRIEPLEEVADRQFDVVVMNPPYSMPWKPPVSDIRFNNYGLAPKAKSDFAFMLHGFHHLKDGGHLFAILSEGVLFRDGAEKAIRKNLISEGFVRQLITLPERLFLATAIPVTVWELQKCRENEVYFLDASKEFEGRPKQNIMRPEHIDKIVSIAKNRLIVKKQSELVTVDEIAKNGWTLQKNVYIDTYEPPEIPKSEDIIERLLTSIAETRQAEEEFLATFKQTLDKFTQAVAEEVPQREVVTRKRLEPIQEQLELWQDEQETS